MVEKQFQATKSNTKQTLDFFFNHLQVPASLPSEEQEMQGGAVTAGSAAAQKPSEGRRRSAARAAGEHAWASLLCQQHVSLLGEGSGSLGATKLAPGMFAAALGMILPRTRLFTFIIVRFSASVFFPQTCQDQIFTSGFGWGEGGSSSHFSSFRSCVGRGFLRFSCGIINLLPFQKSGHPPGEFIFYLLLVLFVTPPPPGKNKS